MSVAIPDFWKLALESQLLTRQQCQLLATRFGSAHAGATDANALAQWLVSQNVISRYQAAILLAGRPGPFCYGDYRIHDRLDRGRLAGWFRAVHVKTNHPVMLKFLTGTAAQDTAVARTAALLAATVHPNLVRFYEVVNLGAYRFVVVEDLQGETLSERLPKAGRLPVGEACRTAHAVAQGLAHLHRLGRPHGDVQPNNIWLVSGGLSKLIYEPDAQVAAPNLAAASNNELVSRADYLAPEFMQPGKTPDQLTDIYALGCSLYEALSGRPPFAGGTVQEKMRRHATEPIQPLDAMGAPKAVGQLVAYMMAKNPAVRFQQAAAMADQIAKVMGTSSASQASVGPRPTQAAYDGWLQQKQAAVAVPLPPPVAAPLPTQAAAVARAVAPAPVAAATPIVVTPVAPAAPQARAVPQARPVGPPVSAAMPTVVAGGVARAVDGAGQVVVAPRRTTVKPRRKNNLLLIGSLGALVVVAGTIVGIVWSRMGTDSAVVEGEPPEASGASEAPVQPVDSPPGALASVPVDPNAAGGTNTASVPDANARETLVDDDGKLLWASPTQGPPVQVKYIPNGARILMFVRPAELLRHAEGERLLKALGPGFAAARASWESTAGVALQDVEQLTLAVYPNEGRFPKVVTVVQLAAPESTDVRLNRWGNPSAVAELASVYQKGETAYYLPSDGEQRTFVMGALSPEFREMLGGDELRLNRDLGRLLQTSDEQRHVSIVFARDFFFGDGAQLFGGARAQALDALDWVFGSGVKAGLASLHLGEALYFELLVQNDVTIDPQTLSSNLHLRIDEIPDRVESHLYNLTPPPYWRPVFLNLKPMISEWHRFTRVGVEREQVVVNTVLPVEAAHNLAVGGEMLLTLTPGTAVVGAPMAASASGPKTIEDLLQRKITLNFGELDLEFAIREVEKSVRDDFKGLPFEFKVSILGGDLQQEGITRNQKVREFNLQDARVADVLTSMVLKANPVTTVKDPSEVDQKLLWVVAPDPDNASNKIVLITTRKAAEGKYDLPDVFKPKP